MRAPLWLFTGAVAIAACGPAPDSAVPSTDGSLPVDGRVQLPDAVQWPRRRVLALNIDADPGDEQVVLAADVVVNAQGVPLWEDGHRWALFVEDEGQRTLLYGAFVPNGTAEAAVLAAASGGGRTLLVRERTPQQLRTYVIAYGGPGVATAVSSATHVIEQWIPSLDD